MRKIFFASLLAVAMTWSIPLNAQNGTKEVLDAWQAFTPSGNDPVADVLRFRTETGKNIARNDKAAKQQNAASSIRAAARLYKADNAPARNATALNDLLSGLDLSDPAVAAIDQLTGTINDYYALEFIKEGVPASEAWGTASFNLLKTGPGNEHDLKRYRRVLKSGNNSLMNEYLQTLKGMFRYNGYTPILDTLRPLIEQYMSDGELKTELNDLYVKYAHTKQGCPAPDFRLKDMSGKIYTPADFRGKVLVVDVWATWCSGCIRKLPNFVELSAGYEGRRDIEFITVSTDDEKSYNKWKYALPRFGLMSIKNLIVFKDEVSFRDNYCITGIPRYFVIDKEGRIVTLYAPSPGEDGALEKIIENTLAKYN